MSLHDAAFIDDGEPVSVSKSDGPQKDYIVTFGKHVKVFIREDQLKLLKKEIDVIFAKG